MVQYGRICLPLLGRAMANQVATKWLCVNGRYFSLQEHCRSERRVVDGANDQPCNATGAPASCKDTNGSVRSLG
jgi:hypothetical protein